MSQESQTLDQTLNKTDFGKILQDNKKPLLAGLIALIVLALGLNLYLKSQKKETQEDLASLYQFRSTQFEPFQKGELKFEEFKKSLDALRTDLIASPLAISLVSDIAVEFQKKDQNAAAIELLNKARGNINPSDLGYALLSLKLVTLYENTTAFDKATTVLQDLLKSGHKTVQDKIYFDLARNYFYLNNKDEAKKNFNYVIDNFGEGEFAKLSKLYLEKL